MGDVVNLRIARKRKLRESDAERAAGNRALHGRNAGEKQRDRQVSESLVRHLEGHRIQAPAPADTRDPHET
jgi:hypothetical protein